MEIVMCAGECGTSVATQWAIRAELRAKFAQKPWLDVFTKQDLLQAVRSAAAGTHSDGTSTAEPAAGREALSGDDAHASSAASDSGGVVHGSSAASASGAGPTTELQGESYLRGQEGGPMHEHAASSSELHAGADEGASAREAGRSFSWGQRIEGGLQTPVQVAQALPHAIWVSSVTDEGMDDLKASVLQMLQRRTDDAVI
jgi:hypothetical protein